MIVYHAFRVRFPLRLRREERRLRREERRLLRDPRRLRREERRLLRDPRRERRSDAISLAKRPRALRGRFLRVPAFLAKRPLELRVR